MLRHVLVSDSPNAAPRPGECLIAVGAGGSRRRPDTVRVRDLDEAVHLLGQGALVRVALSDPLAFLQRLAGQPAETTAQAA
jgi:hypothetical protein